MSEIMTQDEIDSLRDSIHSDEPANETQEQAEKKKKVKKSYAAFLTMIKRLDFARNNLSFTEQTEARKNLRHAAFDLWLANRNIKRTEYYRLMNKEAKKRGMPPPFPGGKYE